MWAVEFSMASAISLLCLGVGRRQTKACCCSTLSDGFQTLWAWQTPWRYLEKGSTPGGIFPPVLSIVAPTGKQAMAPSVATDSSTEVDAIVHQMCLRSLKRTHGMYLSNYGQRPPALESGCAPRPAR